MRGTPSVLANWIITMALTHDQARDLRSLMHTWSRASHEVGELIRGAAVSSEGLDMKIVREAFDKRSESEALIIAFWARITDV